MNVLGQGIAAIGKRPDLFADQDCIVLLLHGFEHQRIAFPFHVGCKLISLAILRLFLFPDRIGAVISALAAIADRGSCYFETRVLLFDLIDITFEPGTFRGALLLVLFPSAGEVGARLGARNPY